MTDDTNRNDPKVKPQASSSPPHSPPRAADRPEKPQIEKLKLVTSEEERLAAEIEKLRR